MGATWWTALKPYRVLTAVALGIAVIAVLFGPMLTLGPRVAVRTVVQRDFVQSVVASGHVEAPHRVELGSPMVGTVRNVPVAEGQAVKQGQTLVELDDAELRAAARQADVAVAQARAHLRQLAEVQRPVAEQTLRQAQVNLDNARAQLQRQHDLFEQGFIGRAALDDARKSADLADAQARSAVKQMEAVRASGSDFAVAQSALAQAQASAEAAHARWRNATIVAPADGVLIARDVERGDVVQPGKTLMVLSPAGETQLVVQIDEKNLGLIALGQSAQASADAYAQQNFAAELVYINPGIDAQRGSVEVKLRVASPPAYLRQDMTVSVDIEVARRPNAVLVPTEAVHDADGKSPWVLRVENGRARRESVVLGLRSNGFSEVLRGLKPQDQVVPADVANVRDASRLRVASAS